MPRATVVWAEPGAVRERDVSVPAGASLADAVRASGLAAELPDLAAMLGAGALDLGVWNHPRPADTPLRDGDRVEIYRPLTVDPKAARRIRAEVRQRRKAAGA